MELEGILKFVELIHEFQNIERVMWLKGREHQENDVEHSYQLAMVSWYIVSAYKLPLDINRLIKYALLHDLVEVYAGDTYAFDADPEQHAGKAQREEQALQRLKLEFTEFPEMTEIIEKYETKSDDEAKFVYALDKFLPPLNAYRDNGRTFHKKGVTFEQMMENKLPKVAAHPEVKKYFDQLVEIFEKEQHLFPKGDK